MLHSANSPPPGFAIPCYLDSPGLSAGASRGPRATASAVLLLFTRLISSAHLSTPTQTRSAPPLQPTSTPLPSSTPFLFLFPSSSSFLFSLLHPPSAPPHHPFHPLSRPAIDFLLFTSPTHVGGVRSRNRNRPSAQVGPLSVRHFRILGQFLGLNPPLRNPLRGTIRARGRQTGAPDQVLCVQLEGRGRWRGHRGRHPSELSPGSRGADVRAGRRLVRAPVCRPRARPVPRSGLRGPGFGPGFPPGFGIPRGSPSHLRRWPVSMLDLTPPTWVGEVKNQNRVDGDRGWNGWWGGGTGG